MLFNSLRRKQTKKEILPYPICSVVAVFKMLIRILNTLRSRIWDMVVFLFSVCWLHVNEFNSFWEELRGRGQKSSATQKVCLFGIFTCSDITVAIVYYFCFLCFGSRRNECNSLWEGLRSEVRRPLLARKIDCQKLRYFL